MRSFVTKRVTIDFRKQNPHVPWREMAGLRDVLIHDYFGVDNGIVWNVVEKEIPLLKEKITVILDKYV
ncbi:MULTISPECIES: HepT-like ribonuclease domain-containing protein [Mesobacillus]|uniref:HepT-like ribonuclease domain-containing protein n=1 Tax=Mesobacillus TaxID=2675231 RepID=UPI0018E2C254